ncbi:hypothetical protein DRQ07_03465 [candidate division KSB1 bacterium]|nr:MAG: hypothetical protein DRQ07_03465 [candidate division KSB1 bacterium]
MERMNIKTVLLIFVVFSGLIFSQVYSEEIPDLFTKGNNFYAKGKVDSALLCYQKIINEGYESGQLYYNIGNCFYRKGDIARAILNYERAKKYIPGDPALKQNLKLAGLRVVDKITPMPEFFLVRIFNNIVFALPQKALIIISSIFYVIASIFIVLLIVLRQQSIKRICRPALAVSLSILIISILSMFAQVQSQKKNRRAVITAEKVEVQSTPSSEEGVTLFTLHSGTVVKIESLRDNWAEIVLKDGKVGWIKYSNLEEVWPQ